MNTRGSQESVVAHLVFYFTFKFHRKISADEFSTNSNGSHIGWRMQGWGVAYNFESEPTKEHFSKRFLMLFFFSKYA